MSLMMVLGIRKLFSRNLRANPLEFHAFLNGPRSTASTLIVGKQLIESRRNGGDGSFCTRRFQMSLMMVKQNGCTSRNLI